jgi:hypothetical protein
MKFKEYTIQLAICVKTDEMENKIFSKGFFYDIAMARCSSSSDLETLVLVLE